MVTAIAIDTRLLECASRSCRARTGRHCAEHGMAMTLSCTAEHRASLTELQMTPVTMDPAGVDGEAPTPVSATSATSRLPTSRVIGDLSSALLHSPRRPLCGLFGPRFACFNITHARLGEQRVRTARRGRCHRRRSRRCGMYSRGPAQRGPEV